MVFRRRCPVCGSKQWHKEPSSGLIACSEGHILQNYRNETTEAEDVGNHMMKKRTLKSNRKRQERQGKGNPKLYHGSRGRYLYFQCQQLILRKQVTALTRLWNLPREFETVCRDIWTLHLSLLPDPPSSEPFSATDFFEAEPGRGRRSHSRSAIHSRFRTKSRPSSSPEKRPESPLPSESPSSTSSSSSEDGDDSDSDTSLGKKTREEEEDTDPELAELLRENSQSEDDNDELDELDDDGNRKRGGAQETRSKRGHNAHEGPANNLAVLMVALWTLRIPVMYRDLIRHIDLYELPYLDPVRLLPMDMVLHLTKHNIQALSPGHAPRILRLHALTSRLAKQLCSSYKVLTPEANAAPILWRIVQGMGGTPTLYAMTKQLSRRLSLPLALHKSLVPTIVQVQARDPQTHKFDNAPIEVSLVAAVIVLLKMVYGLDGEKRSPKESDDPAFALPSEEDYLNQVRQLDDADPLRELLFSSEKPISIDDLNDDMLDEYLVFCEQSLLRADNQGSKQLISNYFPLYATTTTANTFSAASLTRQNKSFTRLNDSHRRPGEKYTIFHSRDILGIVPEEYELLVKRGSKLVGVSDNYIYGLVEKFERRKLRRKE